MIYRITLDDTEFQDVHLDNLELKMERVDFRGFFTTFSQEIEFTGDAYDYIISLASENPCASIIVEIDVSCDGQNFDRIAEGILSCKQLIIDQIRCVVRAGVDDNDIDAIFDKYKSKEISLALTSSLKNSYALTSPKRPIRSFFDETGTPLPQTNGVDYAYGYRVSDVFDYLAKYITDGQMSLRSDFLTAAGDETTQNTFTFNQTPAVGETVTLTVEDEQNNTFIFSVTSDGNTTNFFTRFTWIVINVISSKFPTSVVRQVWATAGASRIVTFEANAFTPSMNITTSGATVITHTVNTTYAANARNLYISDGYRLTNRDSDPSVDRFLMSFDKLMEIMNHFYDLAYTIEKDGSDYYLRIEPMEYFLTTSTTLNTAAGEKMELKMIEDRISAAISVGRNLNDVFRGHAFYFTNLSCGGAIDAQTGEDIRIDTDEIIDQITGIADHESDIFLIKCKGLGGSYDEPYRYGYETSNGFLTTQVFYEYNYELNYEFRTLLNKLFFLPDSVDLSQNAADEFDVPSTYTAGFDVAGVQLPTVQTPKSGLNTHIGYPKHFLNTIDTVIELSISDYLSLDANSLISFQHRGVTRQGYIIDLSYQVGKGTADITLLETNLVL